MARFRMAFALTALLALGRPATAQLAGSQPPAIGQDDLLALSVEELMNVKVTSLSKKAEPLGAAAAAIHVVTGDEIRRSGHTTLPEVLRLVPGMMVRRTGSGSWSIGARGFGDGLSNKLLVLIDGRSVYTPLYGGVFWDTQDLLLEDVERIEVIRGPGGSLWGANAVNGVINVVTRSAADTDGEYLSGGAGTDERGFGQVRYGRAFANERLHARVFGKFFDRAPGYTGLEPVGAEDAWRAGRLGVRADWTPSHRDALVLEGGLYDGEAGGNSVAYRPEPPYAFPISRHAKRSGAHVLARWTREMGPASTSQFQAYYSGTSRDLLVAHESRRTFDVDFQYRARLGRRHDVVWGAGYRLSVETLTEVAGFDLSNPDRQPHLLSGFVQDEIKLVPDRLSLTLGTKVEHNDFTGFEHQPSARAAWTPSADATVWASVSRAIRTPTRLEADADWVLFATPPGVLHPSLPGVYKFLGTDMFESEEVLAYELGLRRRLRKGLTLDVAGFVNRYAGLLTAEWETPFIATDPDSALVVPLVSGNLLDAETFGGELSVRWQASPKLRLDATYSHIQMDLTLDPASTALVASSEAPENGTPQHQARLHAALDLPHRVAVDGALRYVDRTPGPDLDSFVDLDMRVGWVVAGSVELSVAGQNLLHDNRFESSSARATALERAFYVQLTSRR